MMSRIVRLARLLVRTNGPSLCGILAALVVAGLATTLPSDLRDVLRERSIDSLLAGSAWLQPIATVAPPIVVVDIDRSALDTVGPWPWPRAATARLVDHAAEAGAAVVAIDILFERLNTRSPAALAHRLAVELNRPDLTALAETLPDDDQHLSEALERVPSVLGFALDPLHGVPLSPRPVAVRGRPVLDQVWRGPGAVAPSEALMNSAAGVGLLALPGDPDGTVRRVPLLVGVGATVQPGLALEAMRVMSGTSTYRLEAAPNRLIVGDITLSLPRDGMLRLSPKRRDVTVVPALAWPTATIPHGAVVFIGGSAPELGGLRSAGAGPLVPSVLLHAQAAVAIARQFSPVNVPYEGWIAAGAASLGVVLALVLVARVRPIPGALGTLIVVGAIWLIALCAASRGWLFDPLPPTTISVVGFLTAAIVNAAQTQWREARIRQRFSQHLAPQVVELIAKDPGKLKLTGEWRDVTAIFTDIEGFTALTHRAGPEALVRLLDEYFEGVTSIIVRHGGMIDKLVGDAVHAFFNMPVDLPRHPLIAVRCAMEIQTWTESYRRRAFPQSLELGRTRIGIETGAAIVGDVGIRSKLDYTAHGDTVNAAARLEAANKNLGSAICVGPGTATACPPDLLRPTGHIVPRGLSERVVTYEPWPQDASPTWRAAYLRAFALVEADPVNAAGAFRALLLERPHDAVASNLAKQCLGWQAS